MAEEPRHPTWAAITRATVRVGKGSGVVIRHGANTLIATAEHVVEGDELHRIQWPGDFSDQAVLARDAKADVAVLAAPPELDAVALDVEPDAPEVGDDVCAAGFPDGWDEAQPVLARGVIAGIGGENWVNLDGTWGNSGGPLCSLRVGARVAGILLGRAGAVNKKLADMRQRLKQSREGVQVPKGTLAAVNSNWQGLAGVLNLATEISELLEDHFRTGFLCFAAASDLRKLLG